MFDFVAMDGLAAKVADFVKRADVSIAAIRAQNEEMLQRMRELQARIESIEESNHAARK